MAISVNMLRLRLTSEAHARSKNGQPAHKTTGVASANWIQFEVPCREPHMQVRKVAAHFERHHRDRENQSDPKTPRHVDQFGIGAGVCA